MYSRKRRCNQSDETEPTTSKRVVSTDRNDMSGSTINSTDEAMAHVHALFPSHKFADEMPAIIWKHQLYPLVANRTDVDRNLRKMCDEGKIRFFVLGTTLGSNETAIVKLDEYMAFVERHFKHKLQDKFIKLVNDFSATVLNKDHLSEFTDDDIKELVQNGLLANHRAVGNYLLSIPNAGLFVKSFVEARKAVLRMMKTTKFGEILKSDLEKKKLPTNIKLCMEYVLLDFIGSDRVQSIQSPTGIILRIQ